MTALADVRVATAEGVPVAVLRGEVDISNAAEVDAQLFAAADNAAPGLVVDLSGTTYLDSRGIQLLLELSERLNRRQQRLRLVAPEGSSIRRLLLLTHMDVLVPIDLLLEDAVRAMRGEGQG